MCYNIYIGGMLMIKLLIDAWEKDPRIQTFINDKSKFDTHFQYEYVNVLEYCKTLYDIKVTDLGKIFNVERQTIYNYYKLSTFDLSDFILNVLCLVYNSKSIDLVMEKELQLFIDHENSDTKKTYEFRETIKSSFKNIICNVEDIYKYYLNNPITPLISLMLKNNDMRFVGTTLEILNKININSVHFLAYLMKYESINAEKRDPKFKAYERIDNIISSNPGILSIDFVDFEPINKIYLLYSDEISNTTEINFDVPENINTNNIIVNITSNSKTTLFDIDEILSSIHQFVQKDSTIIWGNIIDQNVTNIIVDIFAHEK